MARPQLHGRRRRVLVRVTSGPGSVRCARCGPRRLPQWRSGWTPASGLTRTCWSAGWHGSSSGTPLVLRLDKGVGGPLAPAAGAGLRGRPPDRRQAAARRDGRRRCGGRTTFAAALLDPAADGRRYYSARARRSWTTGPGHRPPGTWRRCRPRPGGACRAPGRPPVWPGRACGGSPARGLCRAAWLARPGRLRGRGCRPPRRRASGAAAVTWSWPRRDLVGDSPAGEAHLLAPQLLEGGDAPEAADDGLVHELTSRLRPALTGGVRAGPTRRSGGPLATARSGGKPPTSQA
jgi:hypothetical protein